MLERILHLHGAAAYAIVFALPALEASVFLGFVFPGEAAVVVGGVLAFEGRIALGGAIAVAIAGAIIGDSVGYEVGRHFGTRLLDGPLRRFVDPSHRERATAFLHRHRGRAVFFGRFAAALRALIPGLAGVAEIPYRSFLFYNALGGIVWATGFTLVGYAAGNGYRRVEHIAGRASVIVFGLVVVIALVAVAGRWIARNPERIQRWWVRQLERAPLRPFRGPLGFVGRRLKPGEAFGLELTLGLVGAALIGWGFGVLLGTVARAQDLLHIDRPVLDVLARHSEAGVTTFMKIVTTLGGFPFVAPVSAIVVGWLAARRRWPSVALVSLAVVGAWALEQVVKRLVRRPRPPVHALVHAAGSGFPSGHATVSVAFYAAVALVLASALRSWPRKVMVWTGFVLVVSLIGFSRLYLRVHYLTDVLGGFALGGMWIAVVASGTGVWRRARR